MEGSGAVRTLPRMLPAGDLHRTNDLKDDDDHRDDHSQNSSTHCSLDSARISRELTLGGRPTRGRVLIQHTSLKSSAILPDQFSIIFFRWRI